MNIGYFLVKRSHDKKTYQSELKEHGANLFFYDTESSNQSWGDYDQLLEALDMGQAGDTILLRQLEDISHQPEEWLMFINELESRELKLSVVEHPSLALANWQPLLKWMQEIPQYAKGDIKIIGIQPESLDDRELYRAFSANQTGRGIYWQIFNYLLSGGSIRRTARKLKVSRGTVYRVKQQVRQVKHILWLAGTFLMTMVGLQIARQYTESLWAQLVIGLVATISIVFFAYSDLQDE